MKYLNGVPFDESEIEEYRNMYLTRSEKWEMFGLVVLLVLSIFAH